MQGAECPAQGLYCRYDFSIQSVPTIVKISKCRNLNQIEERRRRFASQFKQRLVKIPPLQRKALAFAFLLIGAVRIEINAVGRARDAGHTMLATTLTANRPA